jgi:prepilin-type N-terminal cleavage/methylation domain
MNTNTRRFSAQAGFSLIEVLIAVVVLAVGLLALGALQASMTRSSADAKARGRVSALLSARMDELRSGGYGNAALNAGTSNYPCSSGGVTNQWVCDAQTQAGISSLVITQINRRFWSNRDDGTFSEGATVVTNGPEFKRIDLKAAWNAADGSPHSLSMTTDISSLSLLDTQLPPPPSDDTMIASTPVVRQDNPAGAGVIPIAIGGGDATAASNPRPEIIGKNKNQSAVGTRFDVLTYQGLTGPAVIQRRVETAAISCKCQYGAGGDNLPEIYRTAQWPAIWTGEKYEVYKPDTPTSAPGQALSSGPVANVDQSPLCQECCRDHHDNEATGVPKFDPERTVLTGETTGHEKYDIQTGGALVRVGQAAGTQYVNACRVIRVDGFWRTASDMYAKHVGLIKTASVGGVPAKSGAPDDTAVATYQSYVKSYLGGYDGTAADIPNAADGGQVSGTITISAPPTVDERYLHARGLYVDYLEEKARQRIAQARAPANCTGDATECMLPYLPFTTINATELAFWEPQVAGVKDETTLRVSSASSLIYDPLLPTRGRTNALSTARSGDTSDAVESISRSNAGVAIAAAVDPSDEAAEGTDKQAFQIAAGSGSGSGQSFSVRLTGLPQTSDGNTTNDPAVAWSNTTGNANCNATVKLKKPNQDLDPNDYVCDTFGALSIGTSVRVGTYFGVDMTQSRSQTCTQGTTTVTEGFLTPKLINYRVSAASVGGISAASITPANDNTASETTLVEFAIVPPSSLVQLTFANENNGAWATMKSCTVKTSGQTSHIQTITWNESWAQ